jgi:ABC-2 type transport system permease protein
VFFSGLFQLSPFWAAVGKIMPLYYVADALKEVMIKGSGIEVIYTDLMVMIGLSLVFMFANTLLLKRYRKI